MIDFETFMTDKEALQKAMVDRHSVRKYSEDPLTSEVATQLQFALEVLNEEHWIDLQLVLDEPRAFGSMRAKYGRFSGVRNYIVLVGPECKELQEIVGFAGEKLVLYAQALGLNTCWVGSTYKMVDRTYRVEIGNKLEAVIAIGYGADQGTAHRSVDPRTISKQYEEGPSWFKAGVDAALLAPTAINQQKFRFTLESVNDDGTGLVRAHTKMGPFSKMDLGIAKLHFELGAGPDSFEWK